MMTYRPVFRYHGAKHKLLPEILPLITKHKVFVDVFGGAANVVLNKTPARYMDVYNDINGEVVNFFKMLRNDRDRLIEAIFFTPYSREEYQQCYYSTSEDPLERARCFFVIAWQSRGKVETDRKGGWRRVCNANSRYVPSVNDWDNIERLYQISDRLRKIQIESQDFRDVLEHYDSPDTIFYLDPPYLPETRKASKNGIHKYKHELTVSDHEEMLRLCCSRKGKVILSGYESSLYQKHLGGFHKKAIKVTVDNQAGFANETIWFNTDNKIPTLFQ